LNSNAREVADKVGDYIIGFVYKLTVFRTRRLRWRHGGDTFMATLVFEVTNYLLYFYSEKRAFGKFMTPNLLQMARICV